MGFKHGSSISIDLAHRVQEHRRLACTLLADHKVVLSLGGSIHNVVNLFLLVSYDPMLRIHVHLFSRTHTGYLKNRITWLECIVYFLQDEILVVLMVRISRNPVMRSVSDPTDEDGYIPHPRTAMEANVVAAVSSIFNIVDLKLGSESPFLSLPPSSSAPSWLITP
jgi:hypothetical protein